jgi:hypothetical protein
VATHQDRFALGENGLFCVRKGSSHHPGYGYSLLFLANQETDSPRCSSQVAPLQELEALHEAFADYICNSAICIERATEGQTERVTKMDLR